VWRNENRGRYDRSRLRYPSDLTDEEWGHLEHLIPPAKRGGNRRTVNVREVVNGLMYVLSTGCQWRAILTNCHSRKSFSPPKGNPPGQRTRQGFARRLANPFSGKCQKVEGRTRTR
jgi:transposase